MLLGAQAHTSTEYLAVGLAEGKSQEELSSDYNLSTRQIRRWLADVEFSTEVDRLSMMIGIASRAERLRLANRVIRQKFQNDVIETDKDLLDWLKYAQTETDGSASISIPPSMRLSRLWQKPTRRA